MKKCIIFISLFALSLIPYLSLNAQKLRVSPELIIRTKDGWEVCGDSVGR